MALANPLDDCTTQVERIDNERDSDSPGSVQDIEVLHAVDPNLAVQGVKIQTASPKEDFSPMDEPTRGASLSTSVDRNSDTASVHSMPAVHVSEPTTPSVSPRQSLTPSQEVSRLSARSPIPPSPRNQNSQDERTLTEQQRRARHRSAIEVRSPNRLSGFFTNLIHRRENFLNPSPRELIQEDQPAAPRPPSQPPSRSSSPPGRPATPPPPFPPPTLQELGLSLSVLTSDLSPSHFTTPPSSGAFLAPHYLLLCHAQGLDILPLTSPPSPQPYALVRRVSFKSVVVMEQRGVLVAIAGRRDGVRVYALQEVKKAIEWRIDVEMRRERERMRRETVKKTTIRNTEISDARSSVEKPRKTSLSTPPPGEQVVQNAMYHNTSYGSLPTASSPPSVPLVPRSATHRMSIRKAKSPTLQSSPQQLEDRGNPPPYAVAHSAPPPQLRTQPSAISIRSRNTTVPNLLASPCHDSETLRVQDDDTKANWVESSDDEAINVVAAGSSGSQALDERTSVTLSAARTSTSSSIPPIIAQAPATAHRSSFNSSRRNRPSNLDLTLVNSTAVPPPEPSPAPTLLSLRQALSYPPTASPDVQAAHDANRHMADEDDDDDDDDGRISLSQALLESRIPDLPPLGSRQSQQPILLTSAHLVTNPDNTVLTTRTLDYRPAPGQQTSIAQSSSRRRRWSVIVGNSNPNPESLQDESRPNPPRTAPSTAPLPKDNMPSRFTRSHSTRSSHSQNSTTHLSTSDQTPVTSVPVMNPPGDTTSLFSSRPSRSSRFISRIISNAFNNRRLDEHPPLPDQVLTDTETSKRTMGTQFSAQAPPPKLEYVKLPGTKGALSVKAVETAKKSFLAILCGDKGEKVELFAGTYRTALGLSRTFILPDSPRSLELQLQGDDLVEVFLVFSQNVFGLEPATVRVREVRIGRAERRAARRRVRGQRAGDTTHNETEAVDEETNVNVSIGVSVAVGSNADGQNRPSTPPLIASEHPEAPSDRAATPIDQLGTTSSHQVDEVLTVASAQMGPYTTFQQLSFAPKFPLASIADEYIIPPTYPTFLDYRGKHEPQENGSDVDLSQTQFSPPGLPVPTPSAPPRWYYRDPKNVIHGPWKASLMQLWYKDGLLPPDLPVRREEDSEFMPLKDLRLQSIDPTQPFRSPPPTSTPETHVPRNSSDAEIPLLQPISLLAQPRHFGPPALFYSSRGGHSTAIVDARGRSVLKGRFLWSNEDSKTSLTGKMGDVKRLEAFDVKDRAVLVAMRQGGLEAVDLGDALLKPADESRTVLPNFSPASSSINRRPPFVWKIGTPLTSAPLSLNPLSFKNKSSNHLSNRKQGIASVKNPAGRLDMMGESDSETYDEVFFLGRKDDELYICERNLDSFRILRLSPQS